MVNDPAPGSSPSAPSDVLSRARRPVSDIAAMSLLLGGSWVMASIPGRTATPTVAAPEVLTRGGQPANRKGIDAPHRKEGPPRAVCSSEPKPGTAYQKS